MLLKSNSTLTTLPPDEEEDPEEVPPEELLLELELARHARTNVQSAVLIGSV